MKKIFFSLIFLLLAYCKLVAQTSADTLIKQPPGYRNAISLGAYVAVEEFAKTHVAGLGLEHIWTRHRFGTDRTTYKKFTFTVRSGLRYFIGKQIKPAAYDFRYGNYFSVYSMPGILYRPVKKAFLQFNAGPELNIYENNPSAGVGVMFSSQFFISRQIAIGPGILYKKKPDTHGLWALGLGISYPL